MVSTLSYYYSLLFGNDGTQVKSKKRYLTSCRLCDTMYGIDVTGGQMETEDKRRGVIVTIRFTQEEIEAIRRRAQAEGRTVSQLVRWAITQYEEARRGS